MARTSKTSKRARSADILDTHNDPRQYDLAKRPNILERLTTAINYIVMTTGPRAAAISVADIISQVGKDAGLNGEILGPRTAQTVHLQLSRLEANGYIQMFDSNLEWFSLTNKFKALIQQLSDMHKENLQLIQALDSLSRNRVQCAFFRSKFRTRAFKRQATRRELESENKKIKLECAKHRQVCPLLKTRAPSVISEATELIEDASRATVPPESDEDSIYMDDVPTGEGSRLIVLLPCTPVRSGTLNNPGAYPSPESAPRQVSSAPSTSYLTPSRSRSTSAPAVDEIQRDEDEEMEVSIELQGPSNVLFASGVSATSVDSQSSMDLALKEEIERLERIVQQQHLKGQARMNSRRKSWRFIRNHEILRRRKWWKALETRRRDYDRLKNEAECRERQLNDRHYTELRAVKNDHQHALEELDRRHAEEKKVLEDLCMEAKQKGRIYAERMQQYMQSGAAFSQSFLSSL